MKTHLRSLFQTRLVRTGFTLLALTTACSADLSESTNSTGTGTTVTGGTASTLPGGTVSPANVGGGTAVAVSGTQVGSGGNTQIGSVAYSGNSSINVANGGSASTGGTKALGGSASTGGKKALGGSASTGGTKALGGSASTGGKKALGGSTAVAGANAGMRDITSLQLVKEMHLGWNLGNTLDGNPTETSWGNPLTTKAMIDVVKSGGFNTVRVPVTWNTHIGSAPTYLVDETWMKRVEEVVTYVLSNDMYAILNTHHDEWVSVMPTADQASVSDKLAKLWTQIASRFKKYDDHLVFETLNEPRTTDSTQWTGGTPEARDKINAYNLAAVNAIRATGGNNTLRHIMIPTHAANASDTCVNDLVIPNDDPRIIVSLHTYYPYEISMGDATTWGTSAEKTAMTAELDRIYELLPKKGRAVVIGEWGTIHKNNTAVRVDHAKTYAKAVTERGMCPIWWDNGDQATKGFAILNRKVNPPVWLYPEIATALASGATEGAASAR